tara:strand:- start:310 stop:1911 length:1602 start_codon:yes stop_codon:yes gene_type:complete
MSQQPNDGSGRAPVAIVRPTTSVTSGVAVTQKLVSAAVAFGNLLKGTFGPNGLDKMLYKTNGETAVTNDGAKIVAELLVKHPAAKAFVQLAESQENACGDGVTGCVIFASELMRESGVLLEKSLHPLVLVNGYQDAMHQTIEILEGISKPVSIDDIEVLQSVAKTAMTGTSVESVSGILAELVVSAARHVARQSAGNYIVDTELVRMAKKGIGSLSDTNLVKGIVIDKNLDLEKLPRKLAAGKVVVLSCPLEIEKTTYDAEIEISTTEQWTSFMAAEEEILNHKAQQIIDSGAKIVFCAETIDARIMHQLADNDICALASMEKSGAEDVALATGALLIDHVDSIDDTTLGTFESMIVETFDSEEGLRDRLYLNVGNDSGLTTIDVCGGGGATSEEFIRGLYDALNSVAKTIESGYTLCGGGNPHITAALQLREYAESISGRERLAIEGFSRALESIPTTLVSNSGNNMLDGLLELRSQIRLGNHNSGIDVDGKVTVLVDVWECSDTVLHALQAACETACGLLRVDQVISARGD